MRSTRPVEPRRSLVAAHLLGTVEFAAALALQQRLVYESSGSDDRQITLLLAEHPPRITVGRQGSRGHFREPSAWYAARKLDIDWVNRGGGCLAHGPGQVAVYPIVPLARLGWTVGEYLDRLQGGLLAACRALGCQTTEPPGRRGVWGRTGQVAFVGVAVKDATAYFGAYVNVSPALDVQRSLRTDPLDDTPPSSLGADVRRPVRMTAVRETLVRTLTEAFALERFHLHSGHPWLAAARRPGREAAARVG